MMGVLHIPDSARCCQQSFGWHTATIDTCATNVMPFNHSNFETLQKHSIMSKTGSTLTELVGLAGCVAFGGAYCLAAQSLTLSTA